MRPSSIEAAIAAAVQEPAPAPPAEELAAARAEAAMPDELAAIYSVCDGLELETLDVFDLGDFVDVNSDPSLFKELPDVVFFASDRADGFFLLDPNDTLGCDPNAVYWADRGVLEPDSCRRVASELESFLQRAAADESVTEGPEVGALSLERLFATIAAHPEQVETRAGFGEVEALMAARRSDLPITFGLIDFYARYDGLYLKAMGLTVFSLERLGAISGETGIVALSFGRDQAGRRYGLTIGGWRGFAPNRLFVVRDASELESVAILGRFSDVLSEWIEASAKGGAPA